MPRVQDEEILVKTFSGRLDCSHGNRTLKLLCMEEDAKSLSNLVQSGVWWRTVEQLVKCRSSHPLRDRADGHVETFATRAPVALRCDLDTLSSMCVHAPSEHTVTRMKGLTVNKYFQDLLSQQIVFCQINFIIIYLVEITYYFEFLMIKLISFIVLNILVEISPACTSW